MIDKELVDCITLGCIARGEHYQDAVKKIHKDFPVNGEVKTMAKEYRKTENDMNGLLKLDKTLEAQIVMNLVDSHFFSESRGRWEWEAAAVERGLTEYRGVVIGELILGLLPIGFLIYNIIILLW